MNERPDRPLTWEDVLRMPDDGNRYEFIGGRLYMTPAPVIRHHRVSERLQSALRRALGAPGHGEVFYAPVLVASRASFPSGWATSGWA